MFQFQFLFSVYGCFVCMYTCTWRSEESIRYPVAWVAGDSEVIYSCWESNPSPQEEQAMLRTTSLLFSPCTCSYMSFDYIVVHFVMCYKSITVQARWGGTHLGSQHLGGWDKIRDYSFEICLGLFIKLCSRRREQNQGWGDYSVDKGTWGTAVRTQDWTPEST